MSEEAKANGQGNLSQGKRTLKQIQAHHSSTANGAFGLRAGYLSDRLHRGSDIWLNVIGPKETEWAAYLGADNFESLPIAQREHVRLWIADFLLVSYFIPDAGLSTTVKEVRAAMNSLGRLTRELMAMKVEKNVTDLAVAFQESERRQSE